MKSNPLHLIACAGVLIGSVLGCSSKSKPPLTEDDVLPATKSVNELPVVEEGDYTTECSKLIAQLRGGSPGSEEFGQAMSRLEVLVTPTELSQFHSALIEQFHVEIARGNADPLKSLDGLSADLKQEAESAGIDLGALVKDSKIVRTRKTR